MTDDTRTPPPLAPRHWPAWLGIGAAALLTRLPWSLQHWLGSAIGGVLMRIAGARRRVAARNIALCFPELDQAAQAALLRESFAELGISLLELARAWWGSVAPMRGRVVVEGLEHLQAARAGGRGVIIVSGHFVTVELAARLMCEHAPLAGMYRPHDGAAMEWAVRRGRLRYASAMFTREELRPAIRHLKQGGLLWFAPDQDTRRGDSVFVPFFGQQAYSLTSTHQLARLSGAAVMGFAHVRHDDGHYTLRLTPVFDDFPSADATTDTARVMREIETMIRAAPGQYLWIHRRFKRQPGQPDNALYR